MSHATPCASSSAITFSAWEASPDEASAFNEGRNRRYSCRRSRLEDKGARTRGEGDTGAEADREAEAEPEAESLHNASGASDVSAVGVGVEEVKPDSNC